MTNLALQLYELANKKSGADIPAWIPVAGYVGMGLLGGLILLLLSKRILRRFTILSSAMQKSLDKMPLNQLMSAITGLILGLVVAALMCRMLSFMGNTMAATALSAILYVTLGALGYNIGKRRAREFNTMITRLSGVREKRKITRHGYAARKFLEKGNRVKVTLRFRGREMAHINQTKGVLDEFAATLADIANVDKPAKMEGRNMSIVLAPKPAK